MPFLVLSYHQCHTMWHDHTTLLYSGKKVTPVVVQEANNNQFACSNWQSASASASASADFLVFRNAATNKMKGVRGWMLKCTKQ